MAGSEKDPSEKDRLGDKLRDAERGREDQYFAELDRKLLEKQRQERAAAPEATPMRCPNDGEALKQRTLHGVTVQSCSLCQGMWLQKDDLEAIASRENEGWIARWLRYEFKEPGGAR